MKALSDNSDACCCGTETTACFVCNVQRQKKDLTASNTSSFIFILSNFGGGGSMSILHLLHWVSGLLSEHKSFYKVSVPNAYSSCNKLNFASSFSASTK